MSEQNVSHNRANPFHARVVENRLLTNPKASKETRHIVLSLEGSGLSFQAGDSLGVFPHNNPDLVEELLNRLELSPETCVSTVVGKSLKLFDLLESQYAINRCTPKFIQAVGSILKPNELSPELFRALEDQDFLETYAEERDLVDVLIAHPKLRMSPETLISLLPTMKPRLYSIASSPKVNPNLVDLTVAVVQFNTFNRQKFGLASGYLGRFAPLGEPEVPVFVQPTRHFHLPKNSDTPIIMVGPGTGIAPFRAFLQERKAIGAKGKNWLFFGDRHRESDFLYQNELMNLKQDGILTRLDLAFSRDQSEKIYVQDKMLQNASEIWRWLQEGACFYVCGDAKRMAKDVHSTLLKIIEQSGKLTPEQAQEYVQKMEKSDGRYFKDVY